MFFCISPHIILSSNYLDVSFNCPAHTGFPYIDFSELNLYQAFFPPHDIFFSCSQLLLNFLPSQILSTVCLLCWMSTTINLSPWMPFGVVISNPASPFLQCSMLQWFTYFSWHDCYHNSAKIYINLKNFSTAIHWHEFVPTSW